MGTTTRVNFEEFQRLQESAEDAVRYELDEGELILTPSPTPRHNLVYLRLWRVLAAFVEKHHLGVVITEVDFRLAEDVVRKPDVAFVAKDQMEGFDLDRTPVKCAPTLAVEVISPSNFAQDTRKKVRQYLTAGSKAVWVIYPALRIIEVHDSTGSRNAIEGDSFSEARLFSGHQFSISLAELFDGTSRHAT